MSSFNEFIHDLSIDSSSLDHSSVEDDLDRNICHSPSSQGSRISRASSSSRRYRKKTRMALIISWIFIPVKLLLAILSYLFLFPFLRKEGPSSNSKTSRVPHVSSLKKMQNLRDQFIQRTTDRRRGVIEVLGDLHLRLVNFSRSLSVLMLGLCLPGYSASFGDLNRSNI